LIAGYSQSRVSLLKADPMFRELLAHYAAQREIAHADVLERMRVLGMNSLEELQARLEETPEAFSPRELMELTELMLVKGRIGAGGAAGAGAPQLTAGVAVNVNFVTAEHHPVLEVQSQRVNEKGDT
jgi:hypothetical protein